MKIRDITLTMRAGMPVWPGDPAFERTLIAAIGPDSVATSQP
jgi:kynurenine formamidase